MRMRETGSDVTFLLFPGATLYLVPSRRLRHNTIPVKCFCLWDLMNRSLWLSLKNGNGHKFSMVVNFLLQPRLLLTLALTLLLILMAVAMWTRYSAFYSVRWLPPGSEKQGTVIPSINYGIVIDAGSSSSKVYLFQWPTHDGDPTKLLKIEPLTDELGDSLSKKVEPGISSFASEPEKASDSLQPLLEFASSYIPVSKHHDTSLYILCTAGMRLLPSETQERVVIHLQERVTRDWPFRLPKDGVQVISGKLEGVFSWITINYLLGRFQPEYHQHTLPASTDLEQARVFDGTEMKENSNRTVYKISTVGSLDMGGASLQVAFEIPHDVDVGDQANVVEVNLGCGIHDNHHRHRVHVTTYLGYGTNEARGRYYHLIVKRHVEESGHNHTAGDYLSIHPSIKDPCMPIGMEENVTVDRHIMKVRGVGDFRGCKKALLPILVGGTDSEEVDPTSSSQPQLTQRFKAFHRPTVPVNYKSMEFYGTSEFWYTMRDVLRLGGDYKARNFMTAASDFCQTAWKVLMDRFMKKLYTYADLYRLRSQCMKSAWVSLILHEGLGFPEETISLQSAGRILGQNVQWPLGALLYYTRYLPLREVQQQQLKSPVDSNKANTRSLTPFEFLFNSSYALPLLVVLCVVVILLVCRRKRPSLRSYPTSPQGLLLSRSVSQASFLKVHRRTSSVNNPSTLLGSLSRNQSSGRLSAIV